VSIIDIVVPMFLGFREGLESILVLVIILSYLKSTNQKNYYKYVYIGAALAVFSSIIFSIIFSLIFGGFTGTLEQLFEGYTFVISGLFIVTLILWISKEGSKMKETLNEKVEQSIKAGKIFSIAILTYIIIIREGVELVLLLMGATSLGTLNQGTIIIGAAIGIGIAILIGILMFYGIKTINLSKFFKITNAVLILFAAGLITFGIHEFIEAGALNPIIEEVWNIKHILPESFPDNNPLTPEWLEVIGSLLKALFGYNANPSLLEIIIYPVLISSISVASIIIWKKSKK
jgi:high-affinity iron transporter